MSDRTEVAVVGGGGIGGWLAAELAAAGHPVTLCVRTPVDRLELRRPDGTVRPDLRIVTDPAEVAPVPWVLLTTKAQDTAGAQPWLDALLGPASAVAVAQNGLDHERRVRAPEVLPLLTYTVVERLAPGRVRQFSQGRVVVPAGACGARFADLFDGRVRVELSADFRTEAWRKLLGNSVGNPITALTLRRIGVLREPDVRELALTVLRETVAVAVADGAAFDPDTELAEVPAFWEALDPDGGSSMLYDRLAGRRTEHEYLTGTVVRYADRLGVPVPVNRVLATLLRALDDGE